jgi:hypothetical protein
MEPGSNLHSFLCRYNTRVYSILNIGIKEQGGWIPDKIREID